MSQKRPKSKLGGVDAVAEMLNHLDEASRTRLLANLQERDPTLTRSIQERMFTFEDLKTLEDASIRVLFKESPRAKLVLSLRKASEELKARLYANLSSTAAKILREEIDALGPRRLSEVEAAQKEIIELARALEKQGKLIRKTR